MRIFFLEGFIHFWDAHRIPKKIGLLQNTNYNLQILYQRLLTTGHTISINPYSECIQNSLLADNSVVYPQRTFEKQ